MQRHADMPVTEAQTTTMAKNVEEGAGPRTVSRALRLFEILSQNPEGLSLADASTKLGVPKSTLLNSLRVLEDSGFLSIDGSVYHLGPRAFRMAASISASWSLLRSTHGFLRELAERADETSSLGILDAKSRRHVQIDGVESKNRIRYVLEIGSSGDLYCSATGRVLLAYQPEEYQEEYLTTVDMRPITAHTVTDREMLRAQLAEVRRTQCWISMGELDPDGGAIFSPIFGPKGGVVAAIGVALPLARMRGRETVLRDIVIDVARRASGYTAGSD